MRLKTAVGAGREEIYHPATSTSRDHVWGGRRREGLEVIRLLLLLVLVMFVFGDVVQATDIENGEHGFAQSGDVRIHYVTMGEGPLVVMIHGFPDFWYTWRKQMPALAEHFKVVAIDQRGYNKSGQPEGIEEYSMSKLVGDVKAVIEHFGESKATIVGHDWGGAVSWAFATSMPEMTERLVVLNCPHFNGLQRELANTPAQNKASAYARRFQKPGSAQELSAEGLAFWIKDESAKKEYIAAFEQSSFEGMLNYYKANYPRAPYKESSSSLPRNVQCPTLLIHGLDDTALLPGALNDTWKWIDAELTLVTIPGADHFVQQAAPETVTRKILQWLVAELK